MELPAFQIEPGDLIDLEHDRFANPDGLHVQFESELAQVIFVEMETPECLVIGFEGFDIVGFPRYHLLNVCGHIED